jgi:hypothetical protein
LSAALHEPERARDARYSGHGDAVDIVRTQASRPNRGAARRRRSAGAGSIEREYRAKLDDLRRNYALRVTVDWIQTLELFVPVQRLEVLIRRRKGDRLIHLDWHPLARLAEPPPCDWGVGLDATRLVCDERLHLTEPAGQDPCPGCGKPFCRACHPAACPRCGRPASEEGAVALDAGRLD